MWGVIRCHIDEEKIISKTIKDQPILVGAYAKWFVSNSGRKEALEAKKMVVKLKYLVDKLSDTSSSAINIISELKTAVATATNAVEQTTRKFISLNKLSLGEAGLIGGCSPDWISVLEEAEGRYTMGMEEGG